MEHAQAQCLLNERMNERSDDKERVQKDTIENKSAASRSPVVSAKNYSPK